MDSNCKKAVQMRYQDKVLYCEGGELLEQAAHSSRGCSTPGDVQGQAGKQTGVVEGVPACARVLEQDDL